MSRLIEVVIPDIGDDGEVDVIEVLVQEGDQVEVEQSLITLESDKASMEVPSSHAGVVKKLRVKVGDKVSEGTGILELDESAAQADTATDAGATQDPEAATEAKAEAAPAASAAQQSVEVVVPDIGDAHDVDVIEVLVQVGDSIDKEQSLITLETDKASMEVPSSHAGVVQSLHVKVGDKVNEGSAILTLAVAEGAAVADAPAAPAAAPAASAAPATAAEPAKTISSEAGKMASEPPARVSPTEAYAETDVPATSLPHASP